MKKKKTTKSAPKAAAAQAPTPAPSALADLFDASGLFKHWDAFKYNEVTGGGFVMRSQLLQRLKSARAEDVKNLDRKCRAALFGLVKRELARYYGTAVRKQDSQFSNAKAGDLLPKLTFADGKHAVEYRDNAKLAMSNLVFATFGPREHAAA